MASLDIIVSRNEGRKRVLIPTYTPSRIEAPYLGAPPDTHTTPSEPSAVDGPIMKTLLHGLEAEMELRCLNKLPRIYFCPRYHRSIRFIGCGLRPSKCTLGGV